MKCAVVFVTLAIGTSSMAMAVEVTRRSPPIVAMTEPSTEWTGVAASPTRRVFKVDSVSSEENARARARNECEQATGRTCNAIAVPDGWEVAVVACSEAGQREAFLGGSNLGAAEWIAKRKAEQEGYDGDSCQQIY